MGLGVVRPEVTTGKGGLRGAGLHCPYGGASRLLRAVVSAAALGIAGGCSVAGPSAPATDPSLVQVKLIAFNDFHGYLESSGVPVRVPDPADPQRQIAVPTGGAAELATLVRELGSQNPNHIVVGAGDMVGASPLISGLFLDEPSIEVLNAVGLQLSSVGNHEFDRGVAELLRKQNGGCNQTGLMAPCQAGHRYAGARFQYLAANVIDRHSGQPILPAYEIRQFAGQSIAFIGVTLRGTGAIVAPSGVEAVDFRDEAGTVNAIVADLRGRGVHSFVLLIHQGADDPGGINAGQCSHFQGAIVPILDRLDPDVSVVISGHTHQGYVCTYKGFLVTSAASYSRLVTDIDLAIDPRSGRVVRKDATNRIVRGQALPSGTGGPAQDPLVPDPTVAALVARYAALARPLAERPVGRIKASLKRAAFHGSESTLGDVIADAQLDATRGSAGAQLAFTNPGGIRTDLNFVGDGSVTYGEVFASQPFGNSLVTVTLTGAQIKAALEQQWSAHPGSALFLQVSGSFQYGFDASRPVGDRVLAERLRLDGAPLLMEQSYRVTINSFLAAGGDGFSEFRSGTDAVVGMLDADALEKYLAAHSPLGVPALGRIVSGR